MLRHCCEPAGRGGPPIRKGPIRNPRSGCLFPKLAGVRPSSSPLSGVACALVFARKLFLFIGRLLAALLGASLSPSIRSSSLPVASALGC